MTSKLVRNVVIGLALCCLPAGYMMYKLVASGGGYVDMPFDGEVMLSGDVPNVWSVPPFAAAPVVLPGVSWASIPARTAEGVVAGLVDDEGQGKFVALDESNGAVRWQVEVGALPAGFVRTDGWRPREGVPAVPLTLAGPGGFVVAWARTWMLVAPGGGTFKRGEFPEAVPPVSAVGGVCVVDGDFWISIEDGRDGGIMLGADGTLAGVRSDRPASCPRLGDGGDAHALSPLQNARANPEPVAPDDPARGYPVDVCGKYSGGKLHGNEYCSDMRSDGGGEQAVMLRTGYPVFRDGSGWQTVRLPLAVDGVEFHMNIVGYELAFPRAFFDMEKYRIVETANNPSAASFEAKKVEKWTEAIEVVASISRAGKLEWAHEVQRGPSLSVTSTFADTIAHFRSLLLASHPGSPTQNLYVFKPGSLLAVDQVTGVPRFQVGAPHPVTVPAVMNAAP